MHFKDIGNIPFLMSHGKYLSSFLSLAYFCIGELFNNKFFKIKNKNVTDICSCLSNGQNLVIWSYLPARETSNIVSFCAEEQEMGLQFDCQSFQKPVPFIEYQCNHFPHIEHFHSFPKYDNTKPLPITASSSKPGSSGDVQFFPSGREVEQHSKQTGMYLKEIKSFPHLLYLLKGSHRMILVVQEPTSHLSFKC